METSKKKIKISLKRKKPAGKPPVAPKGKTGSKPRSKKPNMVQKMHQAAIDELNTVNRVLTQEPALQPAPEKQVSPVLAEMLQKLSGWTPHSNEGVLEVANRLAQAAKEEIGKSTAKRTRTDVHKFVDGLKFHTLTYWNGVSNEYSLILNVEHDASNEHVKFDIIRVFNYHRIGAPSLVHLMPEYAIGDIVPPRPGQRNELCLQGRYYLIDGPQAMDTIKTEITGYLETLDWVFEQVYTGKVGKKCRRNRK